MIWLELVAVALFGAIVGHVLGRPRLSRLEIELLMAPPIANTTPPTVTELHS